MSAIKTSIEVMNEYRVSEEQVSSVRIENCGAVVKSARSVEEYRVEYNERFSKLTCTCAAGKAGSSCWHRRAALAKLAILHIQESEIEQALASRSDEEIEEQSAIAALVGSGVPTDEAIARVYGAAEVGNTYNPSVRRDPVRGIILR